MRISRLIDILIKLQNEFDEDIPVTIMQETTLPPHLPQQGEKQIESKVRDVAKSRDRVIIIGTELG